MEDTRASKSDIWTPTHPVQQGSWRQRQAAEVREVVSSPEECRDQTLVGAYACLVAIDKQAQLDGLTPQQRTIVAARVRQNMARNIENGRLPQMEIREAIGSPLEAKAEVEPSR